MHKHNGIVFYGLFSRGNLIASRFMFMIISIVILLISSTFGSIVMSSDASAQGTITYQQAQQCFNELDSKSAVNPNVNNMILPVPAECQQTCKIENSGGRPIYRCSTLTDNSFGQEAANAVSDIYINALLGRFCTTTLPPSDPLYREATEGCRTNLRQQAASCITAFQRNGYDGGSQQTYPQIDTSVVASCISNRIPSLPQNQVLIAMRNVEPQAIAAGNSVLAAAVDEARAEQQCAASGGTYASGVCTPAGSGNTSSCSVEGGLGWLLCPMMNTIATLNDWAFTVIQYFLKTPPLVVFDSNGNMNLDSNGIYQAWSYVRSLANVMLVLVFLIIIFSQVTSMGITNYGIKKMLPKLIVGAILINVSFWLAALAIDASNVVGASIYNVLTALPGGNISTTDASPGNAPSGDQTFVAVTTLVLAGTAIAVMAGMTVLLPLAVSALILFVSLVFILTFRHAMVFILIVAAPVALVAYMLPNTEGIFKTWFKLLRVLLYIYPAIAFIMGVSTVAASLTFAAADQMEDVIGRNIMRMIAVAMPAMGIFAGIMLAKTMGSVLGKLGVTNPFSGAINSAKDRAGKFGERRDKAFSASASRGGRFRRTAFGNVGGHKGKMMRDMKNETSNAKFEAAMLGTSAGQANYRSRGAAQQTLNSAKSKAEIDELTYNKELHLNASVDNLRLDAAKANLGSDLAKETATSGTDAAIAAKTKYIADAATASSNQITTENNANAVSGSPSLQLAAAGADAVYGAQRAKSIADQTISRIGNERIDMEAKTLSKYSAKKALSEINNPGISEERQAALARHIVANGDEEDIENLINSERTLTSSARQEMGANIGSRGLSFVGQGTIAEWKIGNSATTSMTKTPFEEIATSRMDGGKLSGGSFAKAGVAEIKQYERIVSTPSLVPAVGTPEYKHRQSLRKSMEDYISNAAANNISIDGARLQAMNDVISKLP